MSQQLILRTKSGGVQFIDHRPYTGNTGEDTLCDIRDHWLYTIYKHNRTELVPAKYRVEVRDGTTLVAASPYGEVAAEELVTDT